MSLEVVSHLLLVVLLVIYSFWYFFCSSRRAYGIEIAYRRSWFLWPLKTDIVPGQLNSVSRLFISHWPNELYGFPYLQGK